MDKYIPPKFEIIEHSLSEERRVNSIKFLSGPYRGLVFSYGKVEFIEDEFSEELVVKFTYDVHEHVITDDYIVTYLGDFLVMMIREQLRDNELLYSGGVDTCDTRYE